MGIRIPHVRLEEWEYASGSHDKEVKVCSGRSSLVALCVLIVSLGSGSLDRIQAQTYASCPGAPHALDTAPDLVACTMPEYYISTGGSSLAHIVFEWTVDNLGTSWLYWFAAENMMLQHDCHPVFLQNLYRFQPTDPTGTYAGRFEQIGTSWLKHGTYPQSATTCNTGYADCEPEDPEVEGPQGLGIRCSDTYSVTENTSPPLLGPKGDLDPETGLLSRVEFSRPAPYPSGHAGGTMVVDALDIHDPPFDPLEEDYSREWDFYFEHIGHSADDPAADRESSMFRKVPTDWDALCPNGIDSCPSGFQLFHGSFYNPSWNTPTPGEVKGIPAIKAWKMYHDPLVTLVEPVDGKWIVAYRAKATSATTWHYEYAVMNWASKVGAWKFEVPVGDVTITDQQFHDVDATSGEACICRGAVSAGAKQCKLDSECVEFTPPLCKSADAKCTNNTACAATTPACAVGSCDSGHSEMCTNNQVCSILSESIQETACAPGWSCMALDYCIKSEDWDYEASAGSYVRWKTDEEDDDSNEFMVKRSNLIHWGEMNTFRFVANSRPESRTATIHLRSGEKIYVPVVAP